MMKHNAGDYIDEGFTLVTASNRIARHLQHQYAQQQIQSGKLTWESVHILPWQIWLQRCWESCSFHEPGSLLLDPVQEQALWQQIISRSHAETLLQIPATARRAAETWHLLHQYCVPIFPPDVYLSDDACTFKAWAEAYRQECHERAWLDNALLPDVLVESTRTQTKVFGEKLAFIGFEELTPQQKTLCDALKAAGVTVAEISVASGNASADVYACADTAAEIRSAANWAREHLQKDPDTTIGIVVPNLHSMRRQVSYCFGDVLTPAALINNESRQRSPFSLSLGEVLLDYSMIHTVFAILALGDETLSIDTFSTLLRTPYIKGAEEERLSRAMLDAALRARNEISPDIKTILSAAAMSLREEERPARFLAMLQQAQDYFQQLPKQQTPRQWAIRLTELLKIFSWPGDRALDSDEHQIMQAWYRVVESVVSLQLMIPKMTYAMVMTHLRRIASESSFQPETEETPVQVLGMSGVADMAFEHLWIMGLHEEIWPPPAQPNPFIPFALQEQYKLPNATADIALTHAQKVLTGLVNSCPDVMISYPQNENERVLRPSPLLKGYQHVQTLAHGPASDYRELILAGRQLESFVDDQAPAVPAGETSAGGSALFKDQAVCPFRAFARHRLFSSGLDSVDIGLNVMERGSILHDLMQRTWHRLGSQENLNHLNDDERNEMIESVVEETIRSHQRRHPQTFTQRFSELEKERLEQILVQWLQLEQERSEFSVISLEESQQIAFAGLEVRTRMDRVDQLADGRHVIIDYKTGEAAVGEWSGERPDDPQLPLYAITQDKEIAALAFARLKSGATFGFEGLARDDDLIPGIGAFAESRQTKKFIRADGTFPSWEEQQEHWKEVLTGLAREFREGDARVNPKNRDTCKYCEQHTFCRIFEKVKATEPVEEDN